MLKTYISYNYWANERLLEISAPLSAEALDQPAELSFESLRKTWFHIWDAELIWLARLEGQPLEGWPSHDFAPDQSITGLLDASGRWVAWVHAQNETDWHRTVKYANSKGKEFSQPVWEIVMHVVNHASYHRGQVVAALHQLKVAPIPATDLIFYLRQAERPAL
ncbi:MAG: DinB family protein [Salibacteraceae bacterium]